MAEKKLIQGIPETVFNIGKINFVGNIIPHTWFQHIRYPENKDGKTKPNVNAIVILADICYWYRPIIEKDETTGEIIGYRKKFKGERLQKNYNSIAKQFGFTAKQTRDAINFLESMGLITKEVQQRYELEDGKVLYNVLFIEPISQNIEKISFELKATSALQVRGMTSKSEVCPTSQTVCPTGQSVLPTSQTYTKITTENTTKIKEEGDSSKNDESLTPEKPKRKKREIDPNLPVSEYVAKVKNWFIENKSILESDYMPLWIETYPEVDVSLQLNKAFLWLLANTHKQKKLFLRYLNTWISNSTNGKYERQKKSKSIEQKIKNWEKHCEAQGL